MSILGLDFVADMGVGDQIDSLVRCQPRCCQCVERNMAGVEAGDNGWTVEAGGISVVEEEEFRELPTKTLGILRWKSRVLDCDDEDEDGGDGDEGDDDDDDGNE